MTSVYASGQASWPPRSVLASCAGRTSSGSPWSSRPTPSFSRRSGSPTSLSTSSWRRISTPCVTRASTRSIGSGTALRRGSSRRRPTTATASPARSTPTTRPRPFPTRASASSSSRPRSAPSSMRGLGTLLCVLALMAAACSSRDKNGQTEAQALPQATEPQATETSGGGGVEFRQVADGLDSPLGIASTPSEPDRLYIVEQPGLVRVVEDGKLLSQPFLDVQDQVVSGGEQGLLSLAFGPEYESTGLFYVDYTDTNGDTRVVEYEAAASGPVKRRELLFVDQPYANHNGGQLAFAPDGRLYVGMGDGGSGGDPENRAQDLDEKLGKLLSTDPNGSGGWRIEGYGLRNPWHFSFDRETHDLWIGDVGQGAWEEIDHTPASSPG